MNTKRIERYFRTNEQIEKLRKDHAVSPDSLEGIWPSDEPLYAFREGYLYICRQTYSVFGGGVDEQSVFRVRGGFDRLGKMVETACGFMEKRSEDGPGFNAPNPVVISGTPPKKLYAAMPIGIQEGSGFVFRGIGLRKNRLVALALSFDNEKTYNDIDYIGEEDFQESIGKSYVDGAAFDKMKKDYRETLKKLTDALSLAGCGYDITVSG